MSYLLSSPRGSICVEAAQVLEVSHDEVKRLLLQGNQTGKDLYQKAAAHLVAIGGTLTVDDSVLDKPYSQQETNLITCVYSGKQHWVEKGISLPVNFRVYAKGKTKNDYFQQMVSEVLVWGLTPKIVAGESWYASTANFKFLTNRAHTT